mgnify:CR=1 FL=1
MTSPSAPTLGVIGLGSMGMGAALSALRNGVPTWGCDPRAEARTAFEQAGGHLADRLLAAMHAAVAAGGEAGPIHSAALKIAGELTWPLVDLRVDWAEHDPIGQLDGLWQAYRPQMNDYVTRALDPTRAPSFRQPTGRIPCGWCHRPRWPGWWRP